MDKATWIKRIKNRMAKYDFTENQMVYIDTDKRNGGWYVLAHADNGLNVALRLHNDSPIYRTLKDVTDDIDRYVNGVVKGFNEVEPVNYHCGQAIWTYVPKGYCIDDGKVVKIK
jgi:hypothetical protein